VSDSRTAERGTSYLLARSNRARQVASSLVTVRRSGPGRKAISPSLCGGKLENGERSETQTIWA
jgi:hypothetical protein